MAGLVETLTIDRERMRRAAEEGYTTATALADALVRRGVPFRAAHHIVGGLVGGAEAEGIRSLDGAARRGVPGGARRLATTRSPAGWRRTRDRWPRCGRRRASRARSRRPT